MNPKYLEGPRENMHQLVDHESGHERREQKCSGNTRKSATLVSSHATVS
jgi:hypothetical protein